MCAIQGYERTIGETARQCNSPSPHLKWCQIVTLNLYQMAKLCVELLITTERVHGHIQQKKKRSLCVA